jgi:sugar phosphate isomerase/epimerase
MQRRDFLINTGIATVGSLALWQCGAPKIAMDTAKNIGIQLYTVRDFMNVAPQKTLQELAKMGYNQVEGAGYKEGKFYGMAPKDFKMILDDNGMKMISGHMQTGANDPSQKRTMINDWEGALADAAEVGQKYVVLAYLQEAERKTIDDYRKIIALLNKNGEIAMKHGINLIYHNHDFEFKPINGVVPYDLMLKEVKKKNCNFELDLYWAKFAGIDPNFI